LKQEEEKKRKDVVVLPRQVSFHMFALSLIFAKASTHKRKEVRKEIYRTKERKKEDYETRFSVVEK
jgi:hypothetical protein